MKEKWRDERGDTLIEVLASILVMALSILLLFGAVLASGRINKDAKKADDDYYKVLNAAERQDDASGDVADSSIVPADATVKISHEDGSMTPPSKDVNVRFYGGEGALSYKYIGP